VLGLSFLFYEAQRSGKLGPNNRIPWRGDSGLNDRTPSGRDVTGGWYDAGDNVKFNLPMAWTSAVLAWSVYEFPDGYKAAKQYDTALANIKWATDYFIKAVGDGNEIVGQVGNGGSDHCECRMSWGGEEEGRVQGCGARPIRGWRACPLRAPRLPAALPALTRPAPRPPRPAASWGRPEDKTSPNEVYTLTKDRPGSDVVGAMAAALASASVIFKDANPAYSAQLLSSALKAYDFATKYIGSYNNAIWDAANFYRSSNMYDDLAWAAVWLGVRTGDQKYKDAAKAWYDKHWKEENGAGVWNNFDWDSNSWGAVVFLSRWFPSNTFYKSRMDGLIKDWLSGGSWVRKTPRGLAFSGDWGSLRHVGNALFLMKAYAAKAGDYELLKKIDCFAHDQVGARGALVGGVGAPVGRLGAPEAARQARPRPIPAPRPSPNPNPNPNPHSPPLPPPPPRWTTSWAARPAAPSLSATAPTPRSSRTTAPRPALRSASRAAGTTSTRGRPTRTCCTARWSAAPTATTSTTIPATTLCRMRWRSTTTAASPARSPAWSRRLSPRASAAAARTPAPPPAARPRPRARAAPPRPERPAAGAAAPPVFRSPAARWAAATPGRAPRFAYRETAAGGSRAPLLPPGCPRC
jgi:hypothetical protein